MNFHISYLRLTFNDEKKYIIFGNEKVKNITLQLTASILAFRFNRTEHRLTSPLQDANVRAVSPVNESGSSGFTEAKSNKYSTI